MIYVEENARTPPDLRRNYFRRFRRRDECGTLRNRFAQVKSRAGMASRDHFFRQLRKVRARLVMQRFCSIWTRTALAIAFIFIVAAAIRRWTSAAEAWPSRWIPFAVVATTLCAAALTFARRYSWHDVAALIDRRASTRDRFLTALVLSESPAGPAESGALRTLALEECRHFLANHHFTEFFRWRMPRELPWLIVPAVMLGFLQWDGMTARARLAALHAEAQKEVGATADALERLAKSSANTRDANTDLARISEEFRRSARELRATTEAREAARKAALRELSALEKLVREARDSAEDVSPEEWKDIAKALAENASTKNVADALNAGNFAEAARELAKAAAANEPGVDEAAKALAAALERLAEKRELNKALDELAQQMRSSTAARAALQKLAEMMAKAQPGRQSLANGKSSKETLQNLLALLQSLKFGDNSAPPTGSNSAPGKALEGRVAIQSFAAERSPAPPSQGEASLPSGLPGSERDLGTTANALGEPEKPQGEKGANLSLAGRLGDGETLSALVPSAGDGSKATVRYKAVYDAMAPAAENAVVQENIPLGARFFIKRYFEAIRPPE
jgi:hypothetical protein